jgi:hypothetical protein
LTHDATLCPGSDTLREPRRSNPWRP